MASKVGGSLDFQGVNAIIGALINPQAGDVASPTEGEIWYNESLEALRLRLSASTVTLASGGGLASIVEDLTPQLGGMLDVNGNAIGDGTRELVTFVEDGSAVNHVEIENEATGSGPIIRGTGDDTNVDLNFDTKGSGAFNFSGNIVPTGTVDGRDVAVDGGNLDDLATLSGVAAGEVDLGTFTGTTIADDQTIKAALQALETALEAITGSTDLSFSRNGTTVTVQSSTGNNAVLPAATTDDAGVMTSTMFDKLDGIATGADVTPLIDDDTMASASSTNVPSAESVVAYVAGVASGLAHNVSDYNASTNSPDLDSSPSGIGDGDHYYVTTAGTFFTEPVEVGDLLIARQDNPTTLAHWVVVNRNLDAASETAAGIVERATQAEVNTGSDTTRYVSPATLAAKPVGYAVNCGATATTTVTHSLGTEDVLVQVYDTSTGQNVWGFAAERTSVNAVDVTISPTPGAGDFRIVVLPVIA